MNRWIPTKFHSNSTILSKVMVCFILKHFLRSQYVIHRLSWLNPFFKAFIRIHCFPKFHCHILGPSKVADCSIFNYFWQYLVATSFEPLVQRTIFWRSFENTKITARFPRRYFENFQIYKTIETNTLFAIFNNKGLGI